jgi:O-antigen/teichoic acid export membrane protein
MGILSTHDYGLLALTNNFISITTIFTGLGLRQVISLEFFHCKSSQKQKKLIHEIIMIYLTISIPLFLIMAFNTTLINHYIFFDALTTHMILISITICFTYFFVELFYQILQYKQQAKKLTVIQCFIAFLTISFTLFFLCTLKFGLASILGAQCIGMLITCIIGLYVYQIKNCLQSTFLETAKKTPCYLKQGLPFIPTVLFGWILASSDRWVLAYYTSLHHVGIYSIADTFGQLYQVFILNPMAGSYLPYLLTTFARNKQDIVVIERWNQKNMIITMICAALLITLGYISCKSLLYFIFPEKYHESITYIWLILIGYVFLMGTYFASSFIQFHRKTYFLAFSLCLPALLNIALNMILIPYFAIYGCLLATLISYIFYFMITVIYNRYLRKIPIKK